MNSFINNMKKKEEPKELIFNCPSCGEKCSIKDNKCSYCDYDFTEYKNNLFYSHVFFNEAIRLTKALKYQKALISICKYLGNFPNEIEGVKLYIYLLNKCGLDDLYQEELDNFDEKFPMNKFIMEVETKGIDSYQIPNEIDLTIDQGKDKNPLSYFVAKNINDRIITINEIGNFINEFYDVYRAYKDKKNSIQINNFFKTNFLHFISQKEISIQISDYKIYEELTDEEKEEIDVLGQAKMKRRKSGSIVTIYPAIYLRHKLIQKEKVFVINNKKKNRG